MGLVLDVRLFCVRKWLLVRNLLKHKPLRPVAPEHASLASRMTIEGAWEGEEFFMASRRWYAIEAPAYPAPIITMSASVGSEAVLRWLSNLSSSVRQNGTVEFGTGNDMMVIIPPWTVDCAKTPLSFSSEFTPWCAGLTRSGSGGCWPQSGCNSSQCQMWKIGEV